MISRSFSEPDKISTVENTAAAVHFQPHFMERKKNTSTAQKRTANIDMLRICAGIESPKSATAGTIHIKEPNGRIAA